MFPLLLQICFISPKNQIIKRNNHIIKTNNQIFKTTNMWIRPRLADVGNKSEVKTIEYVFFKTNESLEKYPNTE